MLHAPDATPYQDTKWWHSHFSGMLLELWGSIVPQEQARWDADAIVACCKLSPGARLLDVPCGDGRVALELARRGFDVLGVDVSRDILAEGRRRAQQANLAPAWHEADMRDLPWNGEFDAAFCWGDSFGYLDETGNRDFLSAVQRTLKPDGRFVMEMKLVAEVLFRHYRSEESGEVAGMMVRIRREFDPRSGRLFAEYTLERGGQTETKSASYRIHSGAELCQLLEVAGFGSPRLMDGELNPFQLGADRLLVAATKV